MIENFESFIELGHISYLHKFKNSFSNEIIKNISKGDKIIVRAFRGVDLLTLLLKVVDNNHEKGYFVIIIDHFTSRNKKYKVDINCIYDVEFQNPITDIKYRKIIESFKYGKRRYEVS